MWGATKRLLYVFGGDPRGPLLSDMVSSHDEGGYPQTRAGPAIRPDRHGSVAALKVRIRQPAEPATPERYTTGRHTKVPAEQYPSDGFTDP
jgi:hypothetical protein